MKHSGAELITHLLKDKESIPFRYPRRGKPALYNAIYKSKLRHILARHEQGAGFMAQEVRSTEKRQSALPPQGLVPLTSLLPLPMPSLIPYRHSHNRAGPSG